MTQQNAPQPILDFLASIGATKTSHHAGRSLQDHLVATWQILTKWKCPKPVAIAGLCHSIYGTDAFETACLGLDEREMVQKNIGKEAEHLAFLFGAIDRDMFLSDPSASRQQSRIDGEMLIFDKASRTAICDILLANELDLVIAKKGPGRPDKILKKVGPIFNQTAPFVSKTAIDEFNALTRPLT